MPSGCLAPLPVDSPPYQHSVHLNIMARGCRHNRICFQSCCVSSPTTSTERPGEGTGLVADDPTVRQVVLCYYGIRSTHRVPEHSHSLLYNRLLLKYQLIWIAFHLKMTNLYYSFFTVDEELDPASLKLPSNLSTRWNDIFDLPYCCNIYYLQK